MKLANNAALAQNARIVLDPKAALAQNVRNS
jgi:hypothetical protein